MNKNAQILIGVGVLSAGAYLYWKSTQGTKLNASGAIFKRTPKGKYVPEDPTDCYDSQGNIVPCPKKNADGSIKPVPKDFFKVKSSPNAENNFKNASGGFEPTPNDKVFANADGVFKKTTKSKVFANAAGGFDVTPPSKVFANMIPTMATHNSGNSFM